MKKSDIKLFIERVKVEANIHKIIKKDLIYQLIDYFKRDYTKMNYDLEKLSNENTLKGLFVKEILEKMNENPDDEEILENALEIGFEILEK